MSNHISITVELSAETQKKLDILIALLDQAIPALENTTHAAPVATVAPVELVPEKEPAPEEKAAPAATEPEPVAEIPRTVTMADIQRKVVELSAMGKKDAVREIVTKYAAKVSAIPEAKTGEVWDKLTALEG